MMDPVIVAIAVGLASGAAVGYHASKAVVLRVGGPFARKPLVLGFAIAGSVLVLVPACLMAFLIGIKLGEFDRDLSGTAIVLDSFGAWCGLAAGIALVLTSCIVVGSFAGAACARFYEEAHSRD